MALFDAIKNPMQKRSALTLARLIAASTSLSVYAPVEKVDKFIAAGATEFVKGAVNPADATQVVVGLTADALTEAKALPAEVAQESKPTGPITFTLGTIDDLPEVKKGGNKGDSYPFEQLAAPFAKLDTDGVTPLVVNGVQKYSYAMFFVPATEARPNPAKALQSTAASATKRYASEGRTFVARKVEDATGKITGAHVIRIK